MDESVQNCPNRNNFCYVCSLYTPHGHDHPISNIVIENFNAYFNIMFTPNLWYTPQIVCDYCYRSLLAFRKDNRHKMKYVRSTIWLSVPEHNSSCYFCSSMPPHNAGFRWNTRNQVKHVHNSLVIPAATRTEVYDRAPGEDFVDVEMPESSCEFTTVPCRENIATTSGGIASASGDTFSETTTDQTTSSEATTSEFLPPQPPSRVPHFITQKDFFDLTRNSNISERSAEILGSQLQKWNLVAPDFRVTATRKRKHADEFDKCFSVHEPTGIGYCNNIEALFEALGHPHVPSEWRIFIDSSASSLKGVLLHIGNQYPSVPVIYGAKDKAKEDYDTMNLILHELLNYNNYKWKICCDLKVVAILTGLKGGYPRHQCFLCLWEGRRDDLHYTDHVWAPRETLTPGEHSVQRKPIIDDTSDIILPPLHIKLGLVRQFVRALDPQSTSFQTLKVLFPHLSDAKIEAAAFNGPQIDKLFKSEAFFNLLKPIEKKAFEAIRDVMENFFG